jgi:hypothetical protein
VKNAQPQRFYNDAVHQAFSIADGRIVENNFNKFSVSRIDEDPPEFLSDANAAGGPLANEGICLQRSQRRRRLTTN